jgi:hypothetical protein
LTEEHAASAAALIYAKPRIRGKPHRLVECASFDGSAAGRLAGNGSAQWRVGENLPADIFHSALRYWIPFQNR